MSKHQIHIWNIVSQLIQPIIILKIIFSLDKCAISSEVMVKHNGRWPRFWMIGDRDQSLCLIHIWWCQFSQCAIRPQVNFSNVPSRTQNSPDLWSLMMKVIIMNQVINCSQANIDNPSHYVAGSNDILFDQSGSDGVKPRYCKHWLVCELLYHHGRDERGTTRNFHCHHRDIKDAQRKCCCITAIPLFVLYYKYSRWSCRCSLVLFIFEKYFKHSLL